MKTSVSVCISPVCVALAATLLATVAVAAPAHGPRGKPQAQRTAPAIVAMSEPGAPVLQLASLDVPMEISNPGTGRCRQVHRAGPRNTIRICR